MKGFVQGERDISENYMYIYIYIIIYIIYLEELFRPLKTLPAVSCRSQTKVQEAAAGKLRGDVASPTSPSNAPVENTCLDK